MEPKTLHRPLSPGKCHMLGHYRLRSQAADDTMRGLKCAGTPVPAPSSLGLRVICAAVGTSLIQGPFKVEIGASLIVLYMP